MCSDSALIHPTNPKSIWQKFKELPKDARTGIITIGVLGVLALGYATYKSQSQMLDLLHVPISQIRLVEKAEMDFISVAPLELDQRKTNEVGWPWMPTSLKSALKLLEKVPCRIGNTTNWRQYVEKAIEHIVDNPSVFFCLNGGAEVSVEYDEQKMHGIDMVVPNSTTRKDVSLCMNHSALETAISLVHEATHLLPCPSQKGEGISGLQAPELTAFAVGLIFLRDYENYRSQQPYADKNKLPSSSEMRAWIVRRNIPDVLDDHYRDKAYWYKKL